MVALINSLLNVSRVDMGTFIIEPELVAPKSLIQEVISDLDARIKDKKLEIIEEYAEVPPIHLDTKLFRMIIENLLTNSIKYTPDSGQVKVQLSSDDKYLTITVSDNGYGIPEDQQKKIYSKLFRADNIKMQDTDGTGLGLYLVKSIITAVNGKISFQSAENKGTTFKVQLPISGMRPKSGEKKLDDQ